MSKYKGRTTRALRFQGDIWPIVDQWAAQNGYKLVGTDQASRTYQRGVGFWVAPQMCRIGWSGAGYVLEAWVYLPLINRIFTLGLMPAELIIEGSGFVGAVPRSKAKYQVNLFLQALGEPLIP